MAEARVWEENAGHALAALTLTPATADDLGVLCVLEVELTAVLAERRAEGWTPRGLLLAKEVRGLVQRIEAKRRAFRLAPIGKEMIAPEPTVDDFAEFDDGTIQ